MNSLLDQLTETSQAARQTAAEKYRELLDRASQPKPGDAEKLLAAMTTLGISRDDVEGDLMALRTVAQLTPTVLSQDAWNKLHADHDAVVNRVTLEMREAITAMVNAAPIDILNHVFNDVRRRTGVDTASLAQQDEWNTQLVASSTTLRHKTGEDERIRAEIDHRKNTRPLAFGGMEAAPAAPAANLRIALSA